MHGEALGDQYCTSLERVTNHCPAQPIEPRAGLPVTTGLFVLRGFCL